MRKSLQAIVLLKNFTIGILAGFLEQLALACEIDHAAISHRHGFNLGFGLAHFEAP